MEETQRSLEQVRRYYTLVDSADVEGLVALFHPRVTYRRPGYPPFLGKSALASFYETERVIDTGRHELKTLIGYGSAVAVEGVFTGHLKDGRSVSVSFADFFQFRDGLIQARNTYFDAPAL